MIHLPKSFLRALPIALLSLPAAVLADPVTFFNTGVAADGSLLAPGTADSHYTLIQSADPNGTTAISSVANPVWTTSTNAGWITPGAYGNNSVAPGYYIYEATLDLTNYDATTAVLSGCVAADDWLGIFLNHDRDHPVFTATSYNTESCFNLTGFVSGINQIDFVVHNNGNDASGLLVSDSSAYAQALPAQTPEPESLLLLGTGALGALSFIRKRRSK